MARPFLTPNAENASLADLQVVRKAGNKETDRRCLVIILLLTGSSREQVMKVLDLKETAIKKIIRAFNAYGPDGLVAKRRPGRKRLITGEQKEKIIEEFEEPGRAQRTFWTASAFHGHLRGGIGGGIGDALEMLTCGKKIRPTRQFSGRLTATADSCVILPMDRKKSALLCTDKSGGIVRHEIR